MTDHMSTMYAEATKLAERKVCQFKRSSMMPCVITDGPICYAENSQRRPICVGCDRAPNLTGIDPPDDRSGQSWERKIVTSHIYPPIPIRDYDWCAHFDDLGADCSPYGWGRTEAEAIADLLDNADV